MYAALTNHKLYISPLHPKTQCYKNVFLYVFFFFSHLFVHKNDMKMRFIPNLSNERGNEMLIIS